MKSLTHAEVIKLIDFLKLDKRSTDDMMLSEEMKNSGFINDIGLSSKFVVISVKVIQSQILFPKSKRIIGLISSFELLLN